MVNFTNCADFEHIKKRYFEGRAYGHPSFNNHASVFAFKDFLMCFYGTFFVKTREKGIAEVTSFGSNDDIAIRVEYLDSDDYDWIAQGDLGLLMEPEQRDVWPSYYQKQTT